MNIIKFIAATIQIMKERQQEKEKADAQEFAELESYIDAYLLQEKYKSFLKYNGLKNSLENMRRFIDEDNRIGGSKAALSHIYVNNLQPNFLFFQGLPEYRNKPIDEQLALFAEWYDENGPRKAVF